MFICTSSFVQTFALQQLTSTYTSIAEIFAYKKHSFRLEQYENLMRGIKVANCFHEKAPS